MKSSFALALSINAVIASELRALEAMMKIGWEESGFKVVSA
jgi:hypothetical protein